MKNFINEADERRMIATVTKFHHKSLKSKHYLYFDSQNFIQFRTLAKFILKDI